MAEYQHLTQKKYLDKWNLDGKLYLIDKKTGEAEPKQSAKSILGYNDIQTPEIEKAFNDVESALHLIETNVELTDPEQIRLFVKWFALHAVRCKRNASIISKADYRGDVEHLANYFQGLTPIIITSHNKDGSLKPSFITCDNPCVYLYRDGLEFWLVPVSPFRYMSFAPYNLWADSPPWDINKNIVQAATDHCVSFDESLHITDPRLTA
jgi:hypothetical protein